MSTIDEGIVSMKFDNKQFEAGVQTTMGTLAKLKSLLKLDGATKGLSDLDKSTRNFSLSGIGSGIDTVNSKFAAMRDIGVAAMGHLASEAIQAGINMARNMFGPMQEGFDDYNRKLTSVQTIMNATGEDLPKVDKFFRQLDEYADKTIYNLTDMTDSFAKFTNAGIGMDKSVPAIKGIANMVALAGQGASQAQIAMYNLSQAMSEGFLSRSNYKSLELANVATKEWKDNLIKGAVAAGELKKGAGDAYTIVGTGSKDAFTANELFIDGLSEGWATTEVMTKVLGEYGDATTEIGKKAQAAAMNVKSLPMMMDTLRASIGTGWTETFELLFGNVEEATVMWTELTNTIGEFVSASSDSRNKLIGDWKKLGGRTALIDTIKNAYAGILSVVKPVTEAFREIFPPTTGKQLRDLTVALRDFTAKLKLSSEDGEKLKRTFKGVFSIFSIAAQGIKLVVGAIASLFGAMPKGDVDFLGFTAGIGDSLVELDAFIKKGEMFKGVSDKIKSALDALSAAFRDTGLEAAIDDIRWRIESFISMFTGADFDTALEGIIGGLSGGINIDTTWLRKFAAEAKVYLAQAGEAFKEGFGKLGGFIAKGISAAMPYLSSFWTALVGVLDRIRGAIWKTLSGLTFDDVMTSLNKGLIAGIAGSVLAFIKGLSNATKGAKGVLGSLTDILDGVTGSLKAMQTNLNASALLKIAGAIAILTVSLFLLSGINQEDLTRGLVALTTMFVNLFGAFAIFQKVMSPKDVAGITSTATAMLILSAAILVLTTAVKRLSSLSWNELVKGLTGLTVMIGLLIATSKTLSANSKGLVRGSVGLIVFTLAIRALISVVERISEIDTGALIKGLLGVAAMIAIMVVASRTLSKNSKGMITGAIGLNIFAVALRMLLGVVKAFAAVDTGALIKGMIALRLLLGSVMFAVRGLGNAKNLVSSAFGMILLARALKDMTKAVSRMGNLPMATIAKGLFGIAAGLYILITATKALPEKTAVDLLAVALSTKILASALQQMGNMSPGQIAKSLVTLGGSLFIIATAMKMMPKSIPGLAGLIAMAIAINILVPALKSLGKMSLREVLVSLAALAGVFVVFGAAGYLLGPVVPVILMLAGATALFGVAALLAGAGILMLAAGFASLAVSGVAGAAALVTMITMIVGLIPAIMVQIGLGIVALAGVIATGAPAIVAAIVAVLMALIGAIYVLTPVIIKTLFHMVMSMVDELVRNIPKLVDAGMKLLIGIVKGISDNIGTLVDEATTLVVKFAEAVGDNAPKMIDAGVKLVIKLVNGVADGIRENRAEMRKAGKNLGSAIVEGMVSGITDGLKWVRDTATNLAKSAVSAAKNALQSKSPSKKFVEIGLSTGEGMAIGIIASISHVVASTKRLGSTAVDSMRQALSAISNETDLGMDLNPTIKPIVDLSGVAGAGSAISSLLGGSKLRVTADLARSTAAAQNRSVETSTPTAVASTEPKSVQFVQNNYSPKPLSRIELYRQTQNQLKAAKGVFVG